MTGTAGRDPRQTRTVTARSLATRAVRGRAAAARQMPHAAPGSLALTHFSRFRFVGIQPRRVDVRGPHRRRQTQPTHHHHKTKTARSQLKHLASVPLFPENTIFGKKPRISYVFRCTKPASDPPRPGNFAQLRDTTRVRPFHAITKFLSNKTLISI